LLGRGTLTHCQRPHAVLLPRRYIRDFHCGSFEY
jgi:hypothetical protein